MEHIGRSRRDVEPREFGLSGGDGEIHGEARMVPDVELGEVLRAAEGGQYAASSYATTTTPIKYSAGARAPIAQTEFGKDRVPFPADAITIGKIIAGEIG